MNEIPQPEAIVSLVAELTPYPWPKDQTEKDALLKRRGWAHGTKSPANTNDARDIADHFHLETGDDGPPLFATSRELDSLMESIHLQLRPDSAPPNSKATLCFDAILSQLTELHGEPTIPWHGQRGLRRMWNVNGIDIDVTYNDARSSLTIGIQHERFFA